MAAITDKLPSRFDIDKDMMLNMPRLHRNSNTAQSVRSTGEYRGLLRTYKLYGPKDAIEAIKYLEQQVISAEKRSELAISVGAGGAGAVKSPVAMDMVMFDEALFNNMQAKRLLDTVSPKLPPASPVLLLLK